jgi:glucan phosphoethanolaminetransferase (alkaline phosphatase superfamily)
MEADEWKFIKEDAPEETNISDDELLKLVDKQLNDGHRKLFIVLHMYGSHFNYKERYPSEQNILMTCWPIWNRHLIKFKSTKADFV